MTTIPSPHPDVEVPTTPLTEHVLDSIGAPPDKVALIDGPSGRHITYAQLRHVIHAFAGGLAARGAQVGEVLAILAPNVPEYAVVFHGTLVAGGTVTTINPTYTAEEIRHQLLDSGATRLVTIGMFVETSREAAEGTKVQEIITLDAAPGTVPVTELLGAEPIEQVPVDPATHVAVLPYSSGTTGRAKGVMLTHTNLAVNLEQSRATFDVDSDDVVIAVLPFFHIYGMNLLMNAGLHRGMTTITVPRFDLEQFLGLVSEHGVSVAFLVPPIVLALAKHPLVDAYDLSSLQVITSGAAPLGEDTARQAAARIDCSILQGYGMTELSPLTHIAPIGTDKVGCIGPAVPNTECRIVDHETLEDLDVDADGELWIRGPQRMVGYLNNDEATAATITDDGWLRTGDIAHVDADGDFWIVDRLKELIKVKGFQVAPAELEELLLTHESIADAAVIGVPDEESGELPKAYVVVAPGAQLTAEEVKAHVAGHVATYKQLRMVEFIEAVPKSASGKILRRELRG